SDRGVTLQFAKQAPPGRQRLGNPESQHPEIGFCDDENRNRNPELRESNRPQVWQDMTPQQPTTAAPRSACQQNEFRFAHAACVGTDHSRSTSPTEAAEQREGDRHAERWRSVQRQHRSYGEKQKKPWER